ncbi:aldehyde dehydrogenase domain-containing protein [Apodospora peruviana]|uniref:Aldehyde dehydrogenase domain-containing protein n=1 Tax=Apodospora peruviana TaxID=516989 RepID=A0AAE0MEU0_9PEZI|nr:aldehyde dehydrogenase domain-containing protein [Apodospora peruviana]
MEREKSTHPAVMTSIEDSPVPRKISPIDEIWTNAHSLKTATTFLKDRSDSHTPLHLQNFVSGDFTPTVSSSAGSWIDSFNPKTGALFAKVPCTQPDDVEAAVQAAKAAFPAWAKTSRVERSQYLQRISDLIKLDREKFAVWESIDQGKTLERARIEVDRAVANFSYFATYILHEQTAARMIDGVALTYEHRSPAGVFALISPWNMPLYLLTWKLAPCLAFGCTAVAKPSEITSMSAFLLGRVFQEAGLPRGVINIIFGDGPTTGAALVASPLVNGVSFTGGTETGIAIRQATAAQIGKHLSLELGGKNPTLVFSDSMLPEHRDRTIRIAASAAFENQGEICLCGSRIYVEKTMYDDFVRHFTDYVAKTYVLGQTVGAVASLQHYNKIRGYLQLAAKDGATFNLGGVPAALLPPDDDDITVISNSEERGYWIPPTTLTNVPLDSLVLKDEIFGPVVTISSFQDEQEAVSLANDSEYGLAAVLLTADGARMRRVGEQLEAGMVWVNSWLVRELGTPFGGMKNSGTGREGGDSSRDVFTVVRTMHLPSF